MCEALQLLQATSVPCRACKTLALKRLKLSHYSFVGNYSITGRSFYWKTGNCESKQTDPPSVDK